MASRGCPGGAVPLSGLRIKDQRRGLPALLARVLQKPLQLVLVFAARPHLTRCPGQHRCIYHTAGCPRTDFPAMRPPGWLLVALAAAAADKNKALVAAADQEKPLYLFGHIPKCGGVSFVADLVQKLRLTSCFGRKAVVAKGENWTHAMERGRCNFVNTEQWQGLVQHFPRPPRVAILVRDPIHHVRSQFAHCQTPGNRAKWRLDKAGLHDWAARWRDAVNGGPVASAFKLCHFNPLNMMTTKLCGGYNHNGLKPKHGWSETSCLEKALEEVATVWHIAPLEKYDQSLCVLGLRLGMKLRQCSCGAPVSAFGQHKQHGVKHHAEMSPATVAIVRDLTRSDDAVWRAASERFDRDVAQLSSSCAPRAAAQRRPGGEERGRYGSSRNQYAVAARRPRARTGVTRRGSWPPPPPAPRAGTPAPPVLRKKGTARMRWSRSRIRCSSWTM